tara:strand:+ start:11639 stop:12199 length:561 start_codon:yes stop_codon:yes gene_type:complete
LLHEWGILSAFRQIDNGDLRAMFAQLVDLYDLEEDEVTGGYLREIGLDPDRLIEDGLLERRDRQDVVLIDEDDINGEVEIKPSSTPGMVSATGPFGEDAGEHPAADLERYQLNREWLQETVLKLIRPLLTSKGAQVLDQDLVLKGDLGRMAIANRSISRGVSVIPKSSTSWISSCGRGMRLGSGSS